MLEHNHYRIYSMLSKKEKGLVLAHLAVTFHRSTHQFNKKLNRRNNQKLNKAQRIEFLNFVNKLYA